MCVPDGAECVYIARVSDAVAHLRNYTVLSCFCYVRISKKDLPLRTCERRRSTQLSTRVYQSVLSDWNLPMFIGPRRPSRGHERTCCRFSRNASYLLNHAKRQSYTDESYQSHKISANQPPPSLQKQQNEQMNQLTPHNSGIPGHSNTPPKSLCLILRNP